MKTDKLLPISAQNASLTMSSREIAELCEKEHRNVMADIRKMLDELEIQSADFSADYKDSKGRSYPCFNLPKDLTLTLIAGYNVKLRKKIIDRWQELENQQAGKFPKNYAEALRDLADVVEQNTELHLENKQKSDHIFSLEQYFQPGLTPPQFVKGLNGANSQKVNEFLREKGWLYKDNSKCWRVFAHIRDKYLTEQVTRIVIDPVKRVELTTYKPVLLEKGAVKIFEFYMKGILPMRSDWDGKFYHSKVAV